MRTKDDLRMLQALPLELKIKMTQRRIRDWVREFETDGVYVSFSGGKDSTVLLHMVREMYPDVEAVFVNTGLEYPEILKFVKTFDNVKILRPKMRFDEVIKKYGYPVISKEISKVVSSARRLDSKYGDVCRARLNGTDTQKNGELSNYNCPKYKPLLDVDFYISPTCCDVMKKRPSHEYAKKTGKVAITGQMADESRLREQQWLKKGCNGFDMKNPTSNPMSFWTNQDLLQYIKWYNIQICYVYGDIVYAENPEQMRIEEMGVCGCGNEKLCTTGCDRTGCLYCAFGAHLDRGESRFERLKRTHPRQYEYCLGGGEYDEDGMWKPNKDGLGMKHVFDELNGIYGDGFIKY